MKMSRKRVAIRPTSLSRLTPFPRLHFRGRSRRAIRLSLRQPVRRFCQMTGHGPDRLVMPSPPGDAVVETVHVGVRVPQMVPYHQTPLYESVRVS